MAAYGLPDGLSVEAYLTKPVRQRATVLKQIGRQIFGRDPGLRVLRNSEPRRDAAWVPVLELLFRSEPDAHLQELIMSEIARIQSEDALPLLLTALRSSHLGVQWWAAWGVGALRAPEAVPALGPLLSRPSRVREAAVAALVQIADPDGVRVLRAAAERASEDVRKGLLISADQLAAKLP